LEDNAGQLAERAVWLFSSGPTGEGDPLELIHNWRFPENLEPIADRIQPRDLAVFHGALHPEKLNMLERFVVKNVKAPTGDFRDWAAIEAWATSIAAALTAARPEQEPPAVT
jgi:menaquinone-dependent protoporphyrinogen oxidase